MSFIKPLGPGWGVGGVIVIWAQSCCVGHVYEMSE